MAWIVVIIVTSLEGRQSNLQPGRGAVWGRRFASGHDFRRAAEAVTHARFSGGDGRSQRL